jgi:hypothetical protein
MKKLIADAERVLKAVRELYSEDTAPVRAAKRLLDHLVNNG